MHCHELEELLRSECPLFRFTYLVVVAIKSQLISSKLLLNWDCKLRPLRQKVTVYSVFYGPSEDGKTVLYYFQNGQIGCSFDQDAEYYHYHNIILM